MYLFVNFCISNFTVFSITEIIMFSVFLQKVLFGVLLLCISIHNYTNRINLEWSAAMQYFLT